MHTRHNQASQAKKQMELSPNDSSLPGQVTPAQREPQNSIETMEHFSSEDIDDEGGFTLLSGKRPCHHETSGGSQDAQLLSTPLSNTGLTVIFIPTDPNISITKLSSTKLTKALEEECQESIVLMRPNTRFNLFSVDTRNAETTRSLFTVTSLCQVQVKAYEAGPRSLLSVS